MIQTLAILISLLSIIIKCDSYISFNANNAKFRAKSIMESPKDVVDGVVSSIPKGSIIVIKYGGHAMEDQSLAKYFCEDVAELKRIGLCPVVVHGGGPQIKAMLADLNVESNFVNGLRVTTPETMRVVQMVLCGMLNKNIVGAISSQVDIPGAIGLSGLDGGLIKARRISEALGLVGEPLSVEVPILKGIIDLGMVPVIAPIGMEQRAEGESVALNINADTAAGAVAAALGAHTLLMMTDIVGVLNKDKKLIEEIHTDAFQGLKDDGTISGGMIPKLETATQTVQAGVGAVSILDGRERHALLKALSGEKSGTRIVPP